MKSVVGFPPSKAARDRSTHTQAPNFFFAGPRPPAYAGAPPFPHTMSPAPPPLQWTGDGWNRKLRVLVVDADADAAVDAAVVLAGAGYDGECDGNKNGAFNWRRCAPRSAACVAPNANKAPAERGPSGRKVTWSTEFGARRIAPRAPLAPLFLRPNAS